MEFLKDLSIDKLRNAAEDVYNQNIKPKNDVEARVYEVLSHKNWGASSTLLNEIARDTLDSERFYTISRLIWEQLDNPRPSAWRVVFKGLTLLEHLVKNGSEKCVDDARTHSHSIRALFNFNYYEGTVDRGIGVREMAKKIVDLLTDDDTIRDERAKARQLREKFGTRIEAMGSSANHSSFAGYGYDSDTFTSSSSTTSSAAAAAYAYNQNNTTTKFGGRYSDTSHAHTEPPKLTTTTNRTTITTTHNAAPAPHTAEQDAPQTDSLHKKSKKKKKKPEEQLDTSTVKHTVDLLSWDDLPTTTSNNNNNNKTILEGTEEETFDAFQTAPNTNTFSSTSQPKDLLDPFDPFHTSTVPSSSTTSHQHVHSQHFDAFSVHQSNNQVSTVHTIQDAFTNLNVTNTLSNRNMAQSHVPTHSMNPLALHAPQTVSGMKTVTAHTKNGGGDDDFGDFKDANATQRAASVSSDPIHKLISLDSLTSYKKKEDKLNDPVIFNNSAAQYVKDKQNNAVMNMPSGPSSTHPKPSPFLGVDGLQKSINIMPHESNSMNRLSGIPIMGSSSGGGANPSLISMQMGSQPMYPTSINPMGGSIMNQHPMNIHGMSGPNSMMMNSGSINSMQHQLQQYSMNSVSTMSSAPMANVSRDANNFSTMGYNNPTGDTSSNRMGGAPMSGW